MLDLHILINAVIDGDEGKTKELVQQAIDEGVQPEEVLNGGLIAAMDVVGERMKNREMYLPEVFLSAMTMQAGISLLQDLLGGDKIKPRAKVVMGSVKGDVHDIGKNLVGIMLTGAGYKVIDLGVDVPQEKFVWAVKEYEPDVLGMSALLTTTMPEMEKTIEALRWAGLRDKVKVIVGGAPLDLQYSKKIGADGYASDAARAVDKVGELIGLLPSRVD